MQKITLTLLSFIALLLLIPGHAFAEDSKLRDTVLEMTYTPVKISLPECTGKIAVVKFTEESPIDSVGNSQIFRYIPSVDIGTWMGRAVYDQLKSQGYDVQYFESMDAAGDMYIITGIANKVYIKRPGQLEMKYKVRFDGMVSKDSKLLFSKNYISKQEKNLTNTGDNAGKLMAGLHDTLAIFLPSAIKAINQNN